MGHHLRPRTRFLRRTPQPVAAQGHSTRSAEPFDNSGVGSLLVRRLGDGWQDRFGAYVVLIDDRAVGKLKRGESARFELSPGPHTVQVAIDWKRSAAFDISGEEQLAFLCGPRRGFALLNLLRHGDDAYLFLEPDIN
jgi:hypothetical protein